MASASRAMADAFESLQSVDGEPRQLAATADGLSALQKAQFAGLPSVSAPPEVSKLNAAKLTSAMSHATTRFEERLEVWIQESETSGYAFVLKAMEAEVAVRCARFEADLEARIGDVNVESQGDEREGPQAQLVRLSLLIETLQGVP